MVFVVLKNNVMMEWSTSFMDKSAKNFLGKNEFLIVNAKNCVILIDMKSPLTNGKWSGLQTALATVMMAVMPQAEFKVSEMENSVAVEIGQ